MKSASPTACVVIPCYQAALRPFERLALEQCRNILGSHDTFFIQPQSLDLSELCGRYGVRSERFEDPYFAGVPGYNRLMLTDEFYARFSSYDYLLIYQLDAFVFRDELLDWCRTGHDYIGAPWLPDAPVPSRFDDIRNLARQYVYRWTNRTDPIERGTHKGQYMYAVGNGGFSLRKVSRMRSVLKCMSSRVERYRAVDGKVHHEDLFFGIEANRYVPRVKVPSYREAAAFAWEQQPRVARQLNEGKLPFGCHGWNKLHRDEWRTIFAGLGHSLDEVLT